MNDTAVKIAAMLGLAQRSRRLTAGTDLVLGAVRTKKAKLVVLAADASDRTKKQITDKCAFYETPVITPDLDRIALAAAIGKKNSECSACAVLDGNMAKKIDILQNG